MDVEGQFGPPLSVSIECRWFGEGGKFLIKSPIDGESANTLMVVLSVSKLRTAMVDAWYAARMSNGRAFNNVV